MHPVVPCVRGYGNAHRLWQPAEYLVLLKGTGVLHPGLYSSG